MAGEVPRTKMNLGSAPGGGPNHVGRTLIIGGTFTFALLYGTWMSMKVRKRHEEALGKNPYYEQVTGNLTRKWNRGELERDLKPMPSIHAAYSDMPPRFVDNEHHPHSHMTIGKFNRTWKEEHPSAFAPPTGPMKDDSNIVNGGQDINPGNPDVHQDLRDKAAMRNMVPPPQRGRHDGSGKAYTKSPDFVKNYEKTKEGSGRIIPNRGEKVNHAHTSMAPGAAV